MGVQVTCIVEWGVRSGEAGREREKHTFTQGMNGSIKEAALHPGEDLKRKMIRCFLEKAASDVWF